MQLLLINVIFLACIALSVNADSEDCQNVVKEELNLKFEIQNDQQHDSDEQFVMAVHVDKLGIENLNPNLPSIEAIIKSFLPKNIRFVSTISATREIVNGFKYELFFVMKNVDDVDEEEIYCVIDVFEKPWLIEDLRKFRKMTYNNCSLPNALENDDIVYENNPTFTNQRTELTEEELKRMEDQILSVTSSEEVTVVETSTVILEDATLNPSSKNILDGFFNMQDFLPQSTTTDAAPSSSSLSDFNMASLDEMFGIRKVDSLQAQPVREEEMQSVPTALPKNDNETLRNLEVEMKKAFSELFQSDPEFQMNIVALINRKDDAQAQKNYNQIIEIIGRKLKDKIDSYSTEQRSVVDDIVVNQNEPVFVNRKKRSNTRRFVLNDMQCQNSHEIDVLTCANCFLELNEIGELSSARCLNRQKRQGLGSRKSQNVPGGVRPIEVDDEDVKLFLTEAIAKVNGDEDPDYEVKKVLEASVQVVAGSLHRFKVELSHDGKSVICDFEVWEQSWIKDGREVTINCNNKKLYKFNQNPVFQREKLEKKSRKKRSESDSDESEESREVNDNVKIGQAIVGGHTIVNNDDEQVRELLKTHLERLDTGSDKPLELVSVEKVTKQVVAGIKYIVQGTFKSQGEEDEKKCTVELWHRAWIKGNDGTQLKADCENGLRLKTRSKRSIHNYHHHRPRPDHDEEHHHHQSHDRHHKHSSALKQMEEVKSEILFENFLKKFERRYANDNEHNMRLRIFKRNLHKIEMLNKHEQGTAKYGINEFADLTEKEYLRKTGLIVPERHENDFGNPIADIPDVPLPENFDWRDKKAVTAVKNQGNCGSCWSFSVTGNIEGLHAIKTGNLEAYSEQELLDCDTTDNACNGGYMDDAFKAIEKIGGLELEDEYPYMAKKQKKCMYNQTLSHVKVKGVVDMPKGDEVAMQKFLVSTGPISIGINANAMQFYRGGVSHPWKILCRKSNLDHGVLIVGYGIKEYPTFNKTLPYWTIKNSWGPTWGEQGYYRVYRGENTCGVAEMASSAVLE